MGAYHTKTVLATTGDPLRELTDMQRAFIDNLVRGMPQTVAARTAGYKFPDVRACEMMKEDKIKSALQILYRNHQKASQMTRRKVMDGMLEAIEMAKLQGDPGVMVSGWREIGRMCGYYAAEKKIIDINITAKRAIDKLETLSDAELLEMIDNDEQAIEGECAEVLETTQSRADAEFAGLDSTDAVVNE